MARRSTEADRLREEVKVWRKVGEEAEAHRVEMIQTMGAAMAECIIAERERCLGIVRELRRRVNAIDPGGLPFEWLDAAEEYMAMPALTAKDLPEHLLIDKREGAPLGEEGG
jgi:hypothetical protein